MRRIKIFVLLCVLVLTCAGMARAEAVVSADNKGFDSLQDAINAAKSSDDIVICLSQDISIDNTITISTDKKLTIDLNGYKIENSGDKSLDLSLHIQAGYVTIKGLGTIIARNPSAAYQAIRVGDGGTATKTDAGIASLTVEKDVIIENKLNKGGYGIAAFGNNITTPGTWGQQLIFNGTIDVSGDANGISNNGHANYNSTDIVISPDAKIIVKEKDKNAAAIYHPGYGNLIIHSGDFSGPACIEVKSGIVKIKDGKFKATDSTVKDKRNSNGNSAWGYTLAAVLNKDYKGPALVTIWGGDFSGPISTLSDDNTGHYQPKITIAGGSFVSTDIVSLDYYAAIGYVVEQSGDVYSVIRDAVISDDNPPRATRIQDGQTLANSNILSKDTVYTVMAYDDGYPASIDVPGTWAWSDDKIVVTFLDGGVTSYDIKFTPYSSDIIKTLTTKITISVDISADSNIIAVAVDNGLLSYDINGSAPLSKVLYYAKESPDITMILVDEKINEVSPDALSQLTKLKSLDLTNATQITTLDLSGVSVDTVILSSNKNITELKLDSSSQVLSIDASDSGLTDIKTLIGNQKIESLNLNNTQITSLDLADCSGLKTLYAKNTGLKNIDLTGCTALANIDVSDNQLLTLDLSNSITGNWANQSRDQEFITSMSCDIVKIVVSLDNTLGGKLTINSIDSVIEIDSVDKTKTIQVAKLQNGWASFDKFPTGYIRYGYKVSSNASMDVTLTGNKSVPPEPSDSGDDGGNGEDNNGNGDNDNDKSKFASEPKVTDGVLSYDVKPDETVTLNDILVSLDQSSWANVKTLVVNDKVTAISNDNLQQLTGLISIDLSGASSLSETLNIAGISFDGLILSDNTSVKHLSISSDVVEIDATGSSLESLIISEDAKVEFINVEDCVNLETLIAKRVDARLIYVDGCNKLKTLDVSENKLLFLDLSDVSDTLVRPNYGSQTNSGEFTTSRDFDLAMFIAVSADWGNLDCEEDKNSSWISGIVASVDSVVEISEDKIIQAISYDNNTGIAKFAKTPTGALRYYYKVSDDTSASMDVTLTGNISKAEPEENNNSGEEPDPGKEDPEPGKEDPDPGTEPIPKIFNLFISNSNGELYYEISPDQTATLDEILNNFSRTELRGIGNLYINPRITAIDNASLRSLTRLVSLDLSYALGLEDTTVNLEGVPRLTNVTLSPLSNVTHINAGGTSLRNITLAGNTTIEELDISNSSVTSLDASGCENLTILNAKNTGLKEIDLTKCENLEFLDVSGNNLQYLDLEDCAALTTLYANNNNLLFLDLFDLENLTSGDWSGQTDAHSFEITSRDFDLGAFIVGAFNAFEGLESEDVVANIDSIREISGDTLIQSADYDSKTGIATFAKTPTGVLRYYYKVSDDVPAASNTVRGRAAPEPKINILMDVTLTGNTSKPEADSQPEPGVTSEDVMEEPKIDTDGNLTFDPKEKNLLDVFNKVTSDGGSLAGVKSFELTRNLDSDSINAALKIQSWNELDLSGSDASLLNLDGVTIGTLTISDASKSTTIDRLTLTGSSNVSNINASGANLQAIDLAENDNIETLNIDNTNVSTLDASNCSNLKTLSANRARLEELDVEGCDSLEELKVPNNELVTINLEDCLELTDLDVSNNSLLCLSLSEEVYENLDTCNWSGQTNGRLLPNLQNTFNLMEWIFSAIRSKNSSVTSADIATHIESVSEVDGDREVQSSNYDKATGIAGFRQIPTNPLRYYYKVVDLEEDDDDEDEAEDSSVLAADDDDTLMDVMLINNTNNPETPGSSPLGPSGAGCNSIRSEELGVRNVLLLLLMVALTFMKRKRA